MSEIVLLLEKASPLGLAMLLAVIVYMQVKQGRQTRLISDNHLSGLPEMEALLREMAASQVRIEERMTRACDQLTYLTAKLNGGPKPQ